MDYLRSAWRFSMRGPGFYLRKPGHSEGEDSVARTLTPHQELPCPLLGGDAPVMFVWTLSYFCPWWLGRKQSCCWSPEPLSSCTQQTQPLRMCGDWCRALAWSATIANNLMPFHATAKVSFKDRCKWGWSDEPEGNLKETWDERREQRFVDVSSCCRCRAFKLMASLSRPSLEWASVFLRGGNRGSAILDRFLKITV